MSERIVSTEAQTAQPLLTLLVFGSGPVIDKNTREKAAEAGTQPGQADVNFWSKTMAFAASELIKRGVGGEVIIMGGRTGGEQFQSEAQLISREIKLYGIPEGLIMQEDSSDNTLTNVVNLLNECIDNPDFSDRRYALVAQNYHLPRVRLLMDLFGVVYEAGFSAEEVERFVARDQEPWDMKKLQELEGRLDMNAASRSPLSVRDFQAEPGYYGRKFGRERKTIYERGLEENVYTRALLEMPEYWIMYVGCLNSEDRIRAILAKLDQQMLNDRFGIDLSENITLIREKLVAIPRQVPILNDWINKPWPQGTTIKLEQIIQTRQDRI